ncbi:MAG: alpha/beta hydrolase [Pseudomonadota bacterium]
MVVEGHDGVGIAADCFGAPNAPALVFVHGWSQSREVWREQVRAFAGDYRVITLDLRGHGKSDRPKDPDAYRGRWTHARDFEAVLDHFNIEKSVIVGWSFGAALAADAAVHLGAERVVGIVPVSGSIESGTDAVRKKLGPLMEETAAMAAGPRGVEEENAVRRFLEESYFKGAWDPILFETMYAATMSLLPEERRRVVNRGVSYSNADDLNKIGTPALLIHGEADPLILAEASRQAHRELRRSTLVILDGVGHWPFLEDADRFNQEVAVFAKSVFGDP